MKLHSPFLLACVALAVFISPMSAKEDAAVATQFLVYVGTYTQKTSKGIYAFRFDARTGALESLGLAAESMHPSFLAVHPNGKHLYAANRKYLVAVNEMNDKASAFAIDTTSGKLTLLNEQKSGGGWPCHLVVDATGKCVVLANYGGGSVEAIALREDGSFGDVTAFVQHHGSGVNKERQEKPHAHCVTLDAANQFAFVCDLGCDKIFAYKLDPAKGMLAANDPPFTKIADGSGPRHLAFHPNGKFAYLINELNSTMTALRYDAEHGAFSEIQTLPTLPADFHGANTCAEVAVHPSGKFLYGSNRGHDSIAVFSIDETTGKIALIEQVSTQGKTPRHFAIDPTGSFLLAANQDSDNIVEFRIDRATGKLTPAGQKVEVSMPVCVVFVPAGKS